DFAPAADVLVGVDANEALRPGRKCADGGDFDVAALVFDGRARRVGPGGVLGHQESGGGERPRGDEVATAQGGIGRVHGYPAVGGNRADTPAEYPCATAAATINSRRSPGAR